MLIKVTQEHITTGIECSPTNCPLALAIKEATNARYVVVGHSLFTVDGESYYMTKEMRQFRYMYDTSQPVSPTEFKIRNGAIC